jgi:hypothetical protein
MLGYSLLKNKNPIGTTKRDRRSERRNHAHLCVSGSQLHCGLCARVLQSTNSQKSSVRKFSKISNKSPLHTNSQKSSISNCTVAFAACSRSFKHKFSKGIYVVTPCRKYTRALTFRNFSLGAPKAGDDNAHHRGGVLGNDL